CHRDNRTLDACPTRRSSDLRELNVRIIDFENIENNVFQVTEEWQYTNGKYKNRADIVFLINGIPIIIVETKGAHVSDGIEKGLSDRKSTRLNSSHVKISYAV